MRYDVTAHGELSTNHHITILLFDIFDTPVFGKSIHHIHYQVGPIFKENHDGKFQV